MTKNNQLVNPTSKAAVKKPARYNKIKSMPPVRLVAISKVPLQKRLKKAGLLPMYKSVILRSRADEKAAARKALFALMGSTSGLDASFRRLYAVTRWLRTARRRKKLKNKNSKVRTQKLIYSNTQEVNLFDRLHRATPSGLQISSISGQLTSVHTINSSASKFIGKLRYPRKKPRKLFKRLRLTNVKVYTTPGRSKVFSNRHSSFNNLRSFEHFLERYKKTAARCITTEWKAKVSMRFTRWTAKNIPLHKAKPQYNEGKIHAAKKMLARRQSLEEERTSIFQKKFCRWVSSWPSIGWQRAVAQKVFSRLYRRLRSITRRLDLNSPYLRLTPQFREQYVKSLLRILANKKSQKTVKHLSPRARVQYKISRFMRGFIFKFILPNYTSERRRAFMKFVRDKLNATKGDIAQYFVEKKWTHLEIEYYTKKAQRAFRKKHRALLTFYKKNRFKKTRKLYLFRKARVFAANQWRTEQRYKRSKRHRRTRRYLKHAPAHSITREHTKVLPKSTSVSAPAMSLYNKPDFMTAKRKVVPFNVRFFSSSARASTPERVAKNVARIRPAQAFGRKFSGNVLNYRLSSKVLGRKLLAPFVNSRFRLAPAVRKLRSLKIKQFRKKIYGKVVARRCRKAIGKIFTRYRKNLFRLGRKNFRKRLRVWKAQLQIKKGFRRWVVKVRNSLHRNRVVKTAGRHRYLMNLGSQRVRGKKLQKHRWRREPISEQARQREWSERLRWKKTPAHKRQQRLQKWLQRKKTPKWLQRRLPPKERARCPFPRLRQKTEKVIDKHDARALKAKVKREKWKCRKARKYKAKGLRIRRKRLSKKLYRAVRRLLKPRVRDLKRQQRRTRKLFPYKGRKKRLLRSNKKHFNRRRWWKKNIRKLWSRRRRSKLPAARRRVKKVARPSFTPKKTRGRTTIRNNVFTAVFKLSQLRDKFSKKLKSAYRTVRRDAVSRAYFRHSQKISTANTVRRGRAKTKAKLLVYFGRITWRRLLAAYKTRRITKKKLRQLFLRMKRLKGFRRYAVISRLFKMKRKGLLKSRNGTASHRHLVSQKKVKKQRMNRPNRFVLRKASRNRVRRRFRKSYVKRRLLKKRVQLSGKARMDETATKHHLRRLRGGVRAIRKTNRLRLQLREKAAARQRLLTRKARILRSFARRIKRRRIIRRTLRSKRGALRALPFVDRVIFFPNRYERDRSRGKWLTRRKRRSFLKLKHVLQWSRSLFAINKKIARRYTALQRQQMGLRKFQYFPASTLARQAGNTFLKLSLRRSRDSFPFRHRKDFRRRLANAKKSAKAWLSRIFARLPMRARRKLTKSFRTITLRRPLRKRKLTRRVQRKLRRKRKTMKKLSSTRLYFYSKLRIKNTRQLRKVIGRRRLTRRSRRRQCRYQIRPRFWKKQNARRDKRRLKRRKRWERRIKTRLSTYLRKLRARRRSIRRAVLLRVRIGVWRKYKVTRGAKNLHVAANKKCPTFEKQLRSGRRDVVKKLLVSLPYYIAHYRMRARLRSKASRLRPNADTRPRLKIINHYKRARVRELLEKRRAKNRVLGTANKPFLRPAKVTREEKYRKNMYKRYWYDPNDLKTYGNAGFPALCGYKRVRRTFVSAFSKNRWRKSYAKPLPHFHPEVVRDWARVAVQTPTFLRRKRLKKRSLKLKSKDIGGSKTLFSKFTHLLEQSSSNKLQNTKSGVSSNFQNYQYLGSFTGLGAPSKFSNPLLSMKAAKRFLAGAEKKDKGLKLLWQRYSRVYSKNAAAAVRATFIQNTQRLLTEFPLQRQVSRWSLRAWEQFREFLGDHSGATVEEFRASYILKMQEEFISTYEKQFQEELAYRLSDLKKELQLFRLPKILIKNLRLQSASRFAVNSQYVFGYQSKKILVFSALHLPEKEQRSHLVNVLSAAVGDTNDLENQTYVSIYEAWLAKMQNHLKQLQKNPSLPGMEDEYSNVALDLGLEHPRFPALGRRRHSFDAFLRGRFKKITPKRFLRVVRPRYRRFRPILISPFTLRAAKIGPTAYLRHARAQLLNIQFSSFPTRREREFTSRRVNAVKKTTSVTPKRRFLSLPIRLMRRLKAGARARFLTDRTSTYSSRSFTLLHTALQKRAVDRTIRDLRKTSRRRRLLQGPRIPFWKQRKLDRRARKASRFIRYSVTTADFKKRASVFQWTFSEFAVRVPKQLTKKINYVMATGETMSFRRKYIQRKPLFKKTKAVRLRRRVRQWKTRYKLSTRTRLKSKKKKRRRRKAHTARSRLRRRLRKKYGYSSRGSALSQRATRLKLNQLEHVTRRFNYQLANQTRSAVILTPLHFRRPSARISVSAEEKKRWRLFIRTSRQRRYRRLIEFSETLTTYFPRLIRWIMEKKLNGKNVTQKEAAGMVQATYWNLRVFLHNDFTGFKAEARYTHKKYYRLLRREVASAAEYRYFPLLALRNARYRFQPYTIHPAASLFRGAALWLRYFLPRFYELHLEDSQKYANLKLTPIKIFRAHMNYGHASKWETRKIPGRMEDRFTRLTTERRAKNSSRFENMLMTTRRTPLIGGYGSAATLNVINPAGISSVRTSFFRRAHFAAKEFLKTTSTYRAALISSRLNFLKRHGTTERNAVSDSAKALVQRPIKNRVFAGTRLAEVRSSAGTSVGSLDIRSVRLKSPRSTEYLQRLQPVNNSKTAGKRNISGVRIRAKKKLAFMAARRTVHWGRAWSTEYTEASNRCSSSLPRIRKNKATRRRPLAVTSLRATSFSNLTDWTFDTLGMYKSRRRSASTGSLISTKPTYTRSSDLQFLKLPDVRRSILHYRNAAARTPYTYTTSLPILTDRALQLKRLTWRLLKKRDFSFRLGAKLGYRKPLEADATINPERYRRMKELESILKLPYKRTRIWLNKITYNQNLTALAYPVALSTPFLLKKRLRFVRAANKKIKLTRLRTNFFSHARAIRQNAKNISVYANTVEKQKRFIMFTKRRERLWGLLTLRWMKKKRLLKGWLKVVKYSFKHKSWIAAVKHALRGGAGNASVEALVSDVLFKQSRLRLRRLTWRERSDRFDRPGFKNAFTFHPNERRNAPWLESLMYTRSAYNFQRGNYKRDQFPREQKHKKWLQRLRKALYRKDASRVYIRSRRWPLLRAYSQRLHRSLFRIRNTKVAMKRFRKLSRRKTKNSGLEKAMLGFGDRLDVNLLLLNIAPTVFWARAMTRLGLLRINGVIVRDETFRFSPGDYVELMWDKILRFQSYFISRLKKLGYSGQFKNLSFSFPGNFAYHAKLRSAHYVRLPKLSDIPESARLNTRMFRWFQMDSGVGK